MSAVLERELRALVGEAGVLPGTTGQYLEDATTLTRGGARGRADAVVLPETADDVARVVAWCYERDVPLVPRGGGTGFAGGAVPLDGGVVLALERMARVRSFDPLLWRIHVEAGVRTGALRQLVREGGLLFPPDPGAAEQSQVGGNIATNAGGPHAFKYGVTGTWVMGLEAVLPPGEVVTLGGPIRKDVSGYDVKSLLVGSEGTLGVVTAAWLRLLPAPEAFLPVVAVYDDAEAGCAAIERVLGSGLVVAALEYLDAGALAAAAPAFPDPLPADARFMVIAEADGSRAEAERLRTEVLGVLEEGASSVHAPVEPGRVAELWRWRDGVSFAVTARLGAKLSEDVVVPLDRLGEAIEATVAIGARHGLEACSWGHAGDGNVHSSFLLEAGDEDRMEAAKRACDELFVLALELGGSITGEHGVGSLKRGRLRAHWPPAALALQGAIKAAFDPKGLLNPGKKVP